MEKIVGIIGGMGPLTTVDLLNKIVIHTPVTKDQDHIHVVVDNYTKIPDRTNAILNRGINPAPYMIESAKKLQNFGVEVIAIACNTAHYYYYEVQDSLNIPVLHMPEETVSFIKSNGFKRIGLIATDGTLESGIYSKSLKKLGVKIIKPMGELQKKVMEGIYHVKRGNLSQGKLIIEEAVTWCRQLGAEAVIAGCTEAAYVLSETKDTKIIDPTEILAKVIVEVVNSSRLNKNKPLKFNMKEEQVNL